MVLAVSLSNATIPTHNDIRSTVQDVFQKRACLYQIQVTEKLLAGHDVVGVAGCGAGKTLSFWMALLMLRKATGFKRGTVLVVTPLKGLGKQTEAALREANIAAKAIDGDNVSNRRMWKVP
jgi:superfamily II DNA helicase RecQ